jgi:hypothetical protein
MDVGFERMIKTIIVSGSLAQRPCHGGHAWVFLQYLLGFKRLGWDVLFLDRLDETMCDQAEQLHRVRHLAQVMEEHGLGDAWSVDAGKSMHGLSRTAVLEKARQSPLLINVMGFCHDPEILALPRCRVFLDIDPGFGQMWKELGLANIFEGHDVFVTIGENIGKPDCTIPTCGLKWIVSPQPIVLEQWPVQHDGGAGAFTSVASWRGPFGPIEYLGKTYGLRVHEFRQFAELPSLRGSQFDIALDIDSAEANDIALLHRTGWHLIDPRAVASDPSSYRRFIQDSKAEFMIAKNMYVETRGGWFSDRSICYLASGKPVLAQETGFTQNYPTGKGLIAFSSLDEAKAGVDEICGNYAQHSKAAREIAEEYFDSDKVLTRLLKRLGVES